VLLCQFLVLAITTGKKKVPVVSLAGCAVVSVFGSSSSHDFYAKLNVSNLNETNLY
jgi:hypothetical protein